MCETLKTVYVLKKMKIGRQFTIALSHTIYPKLASVDWNNNILLPDDNTKKRKPKEVSIILNTREIGGMILHTSDRL